MNPILENKITPGFLCRFTLPSIIMMVVMSLYTVVDGVFVANLVGTDAFSAVNIVYPLSSVIIGIGTMFGTGATAIVSIKLGEGKQKEANQILTFILLIAFALGGVIAIGSILFLRPIIYLLGANDAVYAYCYAYALPLLFFFPVNILQLLFQSLFVANGKPQIGLLVTVLGGLANIVLDYIFIAKCNMGISGAAIATGVGYLIPACYGFCFFLINRRGSLYFVRPKMNWRALRHAMANGSSEMVNNLSTSITTFLFNIIMMHLIGQDGVAAIAIILYLDFVLIAISLGYSMGVAPLFSYNYGSQNREKLGKLYRYSCRFCMIIGISMTMGTVIFTQPLSSVFAKEGTTVYQLAEAGLRIYACSYLFKGFNIFASAMFTAFGNGKVSALLSFLRTFVLLIVCLVGLSILFGIDGVWIATPLAECIAFMLSVYYCIKYKKIYGYLTKAEKVFI